MRTIFNSLLSFTLLMALSGMAKAQPSTDIVGSWSCESDGILTFLATFNQGGVFTASSNQLFISVNHGSWQRTGLDTFRSTGLAFIYDSAGNANFIQKINALATMSDNQNLTADLEITITALDGMVVETLTTTAACERIRL